MPLARFEVERALEPRRRAHDRGPRPGVSRPPPRRSARCRRASCATSWSSSSPAGSASRRASSPPLLAGGPRRPVPDQGPPRANGAHAALDRREQSERAFLAYCLALPEEGEERLAAADLDELFSAPATRRAAEYLRGRLRSPAGELPAGDEPLARLVAELVIRAGELEATPAKLELEALQLDLHNLDRRIATARTEGHEHIHDLAAERQQVLDRIRHRLS